jgi:general secretion pathway protein G
MSIERRRDVPPQALRAFTLIELLIVIAILLALGGLVVVNLIPKQKEADVNLARAQIDMLVKAMDYFMLDMKRYPTQEEGLAALWIKDPIEDEEEAKRWKGPYVQGPLGKDTWGSEWAYRNPSDEEGLPYDIVSAGPDKEEGTEDDITNHDRLRDEEGEISRDLPTVETGGARGGT